jgi:nucleoid-associated protein YgaU
VAAAAVAVACRAPRMAVAAERAFARATPDTLRRVLLVCCGVALSGAAALPAGAATVRAPDTLPATAAGTSVAGRLAGLALPDRQTGRPPEPSGWVTVRAGDSLWAIARRLLPAGADDHQISVTWHRIAAANREVLAARPDLIHPGTRLRVPADRRDRS